MPFAEGRRWADARPGIERMAAAKLARASRRHLTRVDHAFSHFEGRYVAYEVVARSAGRSRDIIWRDPWALRVGVPVPHAKILRALRAGPPDGRAPRARARRD
jgi:hypothetical protein